MAVFWGIIASNAVVAALLAIGAGLLGRIWKHPQRCMPSGSWSCSSSSRRR